MRMMQIFKKQPQKLFLIDGIGALTSAFLLGIVLVEFQPLFGLPVSTLYFLASFPVFFALFDYYAYHKESKFIPIGLKSIATLNIFYCIVSIGFALYHNVSISFLGWCYILVEVGIISILAFWEMKIAQDLA